MGKDSKDLTSVLLVMDIQTATVGRLGNGPEAKQLIGATQKAITAARAAGIPVIYVVVGFRKDFPEISDNNQSFSQVKQNAAAMSALIEPLAVLPDVAPQPGEVVVTKRRISAFTGSDLEVILRAYGAQHLVLTGYATSGVVLSTIREAADKDYRLSVLSDACADPDPEVHTVLLTKVFPRQGEVLTTEEWIAGRLQAK